MNPSPSSIRSKTSSISYVFIFFLLISLLFASGCGAPRASVAKLGTIKELPAPAPRVIPPWQTWSTENYGLPELILAEKLIDEGRLPEAIDAYANALNVAPAELKSEILVRRSGTLLKASRSREALDAISQNFADLQRAPEAADPRTALIAAFAYEQLGDLDQALSWQSVTYRNDAKRSHLTTRAISESKRIIRGINLDKFEDAESRWAVDGFIGPLFAAERARRIKGGRPEYVSISRWFNPTSYGAPSVFSALAPAASTSTDLLSKEGVAFAALLPLDGRFADHGALVREGLELAFAEAEKEGFKLRLIVADEGAQAGGEYLRLTKEEGVKFFFGPLLVNGTKSVASQAAQVGVPFLSFTKREGIMGTATQNAFRLGVTAESQAAELVGFATEELSLSKFALVYPNNESGKELAAAFRRKVKAQNGILTNEFSYDALSSDGFTQLLPLLSQTPPQAIFVADTLENVGPYLPQLKSGELGSIVLLGSATWDDRAALRAYAGSLEGAFFVSPFYAESSQPEVAHFVRSFKDKFGKEPTLLSAQAFDAARLVIQSGLSGDKLGLNVTSEHLKKQLRATKNFNGVTGLLGVTSGGEVSRRMTVLRFSSGELVEVMANGLRKGFLDYEQKAQTNLGGWPGQ